MVWKPFRLSLLTPFVPKSSMSRNPDPMLPPAPPFTNPESSAASSSDVEALAATTARGILDGSVDFELHCQPIVDLRRGVVAGYEALARFPNGVRPDRCLNAATRLGSGIDLEAKLARRAFSLRDLLPQNTFLSLNLSPEFLLSHQWDDLMTDFSDFSRIVVEITEQSPITDYPATRRRGEALHKAGGSLAIDDTGSGYSSLKHILELRPDFIKLDRLFISKCHVETAKRAFIQLLGETADHLDAWVIAEGVEEEPELEELLRLQVPLGQGWLMGRAAATMCQVDPALAALMRRHSLESDRTRSVLPQTELCPTAATPRAAEAILVERPSVVAVAVVDAWNRPLELVERHPLLGIRTVPQLMRVQAASLREQVLARAVTRSNSRNFDSVAVIDEQGGFVGVLRMDVLVRAVLMDREQPAGGAGSSVAEQISRFEGSPFLT